MSEIEISVAELQRRQKAGDKFLLVDVREQWEYDACRIEGAKLIPMRTIPANLQALDGEEDVICYCHHGQRSLDVAAWLRSQGVESAQSLAGGIDRWSTEIDPNVPRY
jgi:rhodanese-related sulfurtransferase